MADTVVDFIRHGKPEGGNRFRGHGIDDPLSETGWQQMWQAVGEAAPWSRIISSPLQRCRAFAEALAGRHGLPLAIDARFREVGFGEWEGLARDHVRTERAAEYAAFYADPVRNRPAGAEPLADFVARVGAAYEDLLAQHPGQHLLVVAHAGVIRAIVAHVLAAPLARAYRVQVDNAALTRVRHSRHGSVLDFHNLPRL